MSKKSKKRPVRIPVTVTGGIRSQAGRGRHAHHWWGQRWMAMLETLMPGPRLGRGRSYAASGQVAELQLGAGVVRASVQGANPEPYHVELRFRTLDAAGRHLVLAALHNRPMLAARLLVRQLPPEVETIFREAGCPLFPEGRGELEMACSCPDWTSLCKHTAAVNILLAEVMDRDPMLLLALRGMGREELLGGRLSLPVAHVAKEEEAPERPESLAIDPAAFWGAGAADTKHADPDFGTASTCADTAPLVRRLGPLPFWRGEERFLDAMHTVYARAAPRGWAVWSGETLEGRRTESRDAPAAGFHIRRRRLNMDLTMR
ncbi:MAG: hypothetical protein ACOYOU_09760 [Kiritimatiellia bacterium]